MLSRYLNHRLVAIVAAVLLVSWIVQGLTYAVLREVSPTVGSRNLIERELRFAKSDRFTVHLTPGQNLLLLFVQSVHNLSGFTLVAVFLGVAWTYKEPNPPARRAIKPLSLDSGEGPDETPRP